MPPLHLVLWLVALMMRYHVAVPIAADGPVPVTPVAEQHVVETPQSILFEEINAERQKAGQAPLGYDSRLEQAGELRVADMIEHGYFSHRSPDGMEYPQAVYAAGFRSFAWAGENLYETNLTPDAEVAAHRAIDRFMGSPTHRAILLDPVFDHVGVGLGQGADGVFIFAVIFIGGGQ